MIRKKIITFVGVLTIVLSFVLFVTLNDELKKHAKEEAVSLISDLNEIDASLLQVDSAELAPERGSYAIAVRNKEDAKTYQVAVILNEEQNDINFAIDVTETYDKYGLAYCH